MKIMIIDDDKAFSEQIKNDLFVFFSERNCRTEYIILNKNFESVPLNRADIVFMDIDLNETNGIELAQKIQNDGLCNLLVFVTSYSHLVFDSLVVHPFFFIRKVQYKKDMTVFFELIHEYFNKNIFLSLKWLGDSYLVSQTDIIYIETKDRMLVIHTADKNYYDTRSLKEIMECLDSRSFIQIYKSFIINFDYLLNYNANEVLMVGNNKIPIGRTFKKNFIDNYERYLENGLL